MAGISARGSWWMATRLAKIYWLHSEQQLNGRLTHLEESTTMSLFLTLSLALPSGLTRPDNVTFSPLCHRINKGLSLSLSFSLLFLFIGRCLCVIIASILWNPMHVEMIEFTTGFFLLQKSVEITFRYCLNSNAFSIRASFSNACYAIRVSTVLTCWGIWLDFNFWWS